jgi:two-component system response regulator HydG
MARILIVDDHDAMREGLELHLRRRGHRTVAVNGGQAAIDAVHDAPFDLVITDLKMAGVGGIDVLAAVKEISPDTEVLVITGYGTIENAVEAMKLVADREEKARLRKENLELRVENRALRDGEGTGYGEIVGSAPAMLDVFRWIERVSRSDSNVMIYGESGTGKELVARAIHAGSNRRSGPFVRVNCGALAEGLLDSELFGHEKGAFTGADRQRRGRFELAHGGTLFLDEISTVSEGTQVRLLRVLQERELERVGGEETLPVDVRIIAATNTPPEELSASPTFRSDLFYRLHVVPITLPPLRERVDDVELLAAHFVAKLSARAGSPVRSISSEALARLRSHPWPGNVRELENVIERALVLAETDELQASDLPSFTDHGSLEEADAARAAEESRDLSLPPEGMDLNEEVQELESHFIRRAMAQADGVKAEAARLLGIKPSALYYKLEKYGIEG